MLSTNFTKLAAMCAVLVPFASAYSVDYLFYNDVPSLDVPTCSPPAAAIGRLDTGTVANPAAGTCLDITPSYTASLGLSKLDPDVVCRMYLYAGPNCIGSNISTLLVPGQQSPCMSIFATGIAGSKIPTKSVQAVCLSQ